MEKFQNSISLSNRVTHHINNNTKDLDFQRLPIRGAY